MSFRETLLAAQRNQQQKSYESSYYKSGYDPPKKEQKQRKELSVNVQKFLAKQEHEKKQKNLEAQRKREELIAMRDPKALRKIQKTLKVIKSANKSVIEDAVDRDNTAVTREGPYQPDQDDYGYESKESAAIYEKMMQKYSKIPVEPKFPLGNNSVHKDLNGTRERVKNALQHEDDPVPHKRKRKRENSEREVTPPKAESDRKKDEPPAKPKIRKPMPPPMDFNQLMKIAQEKKGDPLELVAKKVAAEPETERPMTKKQKQQYEEEMARRQRRQERLDAERGVKRRIPRDERPPEREKKSEPIGFGRIPKVGEKATSNQRSDSPKTFNKERLDKNRMEKLRFEKEKAQFEREKAEFERKKALLERDKAERDEERLKKERLDKLKAEKEKIEREMKKLECKTKLESKPIDRSKLQDKIVDKSRDKERDERSTREPIRHEMKKSIDLKSQNTYRIDKNSNEKKLSTTMSKVDGNYLNGHSSQGKSLSKSNVQQKERGMVPKPKGFDGSPKLNGHSKPDDGRRLPESKGVPKKPEGGRSAPQAGSSKPKVSNSFDFDKHVSSIGKNGGRQFPPGDVKRKSQPDDRRKHKRRLDSESEYDSEMDDFIDDGDENMDVSKHIKEIFGYDKSRYRDDDDDPKMESSYAQQQREEYLSKKQALMEDLEDMRMEALLKKKGKKKRTLSDD